MGQDPIINVVLAYGFAAICIELPAGSPTLTCVCVRPNMRRENWGAKLKTQELAMTPTKWDKVKAIFGVKSAERFGQAGPAIKREQAVGSQSETQTVDPMASGKSTVDCLGPPIIPALHGPLPRKASHSLAFGQIVAGRFEILRFINSGGMGEVYEAWDSELRERIALKTIRPEIASSPSAIER